MGTKTIPTWEEFLATSREGHKSEWVDGEILTMSPVNLYHEMILIRLLTVLVEYCRDHKDWLCFPSNGAFTMASGNWRCPDASFVRRTRFPETLPTMADFPPDVAFEILSPSESSSSVQRKQKDYLESRVIQVWIDPEKHLIELIEPERPLRFFQGQQPLAVSCLPGFQLIPEDLFKI